MVKSDVLLRRRLLVRLQTLLQTHREAGTLAHPGKANKGGMYGRRGHTFSRILIRKRASLQKLTYSSSCSGVSVFCGAKGGALGIYFESTKLPKHES